jgi:hypothetical protein
MSMSGRVLLFHFSCACLWLQCVQSSVVFPLPAQFLNANVFVEAVAPGGNLTRVQPFYSNSMNAALIENYGQLKVTARLTGRPLPKTYVKVYAREKGGR